ncbi:MAG TPA: hypothetical protein VK464_18485 [Symbiobacteriaceae bacterium]|nr:hypothetical protein [Symbiobacteriaceae bacterium]
MYGGPTSQPEQRVWSCAANHQQNGQASGGQLIVTTRAIYFEPHALNFSTQGFYCPLEAIAAVGKEPVNLRDFFSGGLRSRLRLQLTSGQVELFVVNGLDKVIPWLQSFLVQQRGY